MKKIPLLLGLALCSLFLASCSESPALFIQVTDTQFGFAADNANIDYEIGTFTKTVEDINAISPDAVIFTGDLVHDNQDQTQWDAFRRIALGIDSSIAKFSIPGNHDVIISEETGTVDNTPYAKNIGLERFATVVKGVKLVGINSNYVKYAYGSAAEESQFEWLKDQLSSKEKMHILFMHHSIFLNSMDEEVNYFNMPTDTRVKYFNLFHESGLNALFTGHKHANFYGSYEGMPVVTTSAVGRQLGEDKSGFRAIVCYKGKVYHHYFALDEDFPTDRKDLIDFCMKNSQ